MNNIALLPTARDYNASQMKLVRSTVAAECNEPEFNLFIEVAQRLGLDPFRKQIYAVVYNANKPDKRKMAIITGIDGFRALAERSRAYRPDEDEPQYFYDDNLKGPSNPLGIERCVVTVHKFGPDGSWYPLKGVAYWDEFAPIIPGGKWEDKGDTWRDGNPKKTFAPDGTFTLQAGNWVTMGRVMIAKCAEAQALRRGWPEDLSGVYSPEEMDQQMVDITPSELIEQGEQEARERLVNTADKIAIVWAGGDPIDYVPLGEMADRCLSFIRDADSLTGLVWWKNTNQLSLQEFWAKLKTDALAVKASLEAKITQLETPEQEQN